MDGWDSTTGTHGNGAWWGRGQLSRCGPSSSVSAAASLAGRPSRRTGTSPSSPRASGSARGQSGRANGRKTGAHLEGAQQRLVDAHHRTGVVELAAIVWRGEERDQMPFCEEFVSVLDDLSPRRRAQANCQHRGRPATEGSSRISEMRPHTWCARQIRSISCFCRNLDTTSGPADQPRTTLSNAHTRTHNYEDYYKLGSCTLLKNFFSFFHPLFFLAWDCVCDQSVLAFSWVFALTPLPFFLNPLFL